MSDDVREPALCAFFGLLEGLGATALRNPETEIEAHEMPALVQVDGGDDLEPGDTGEDVVLYRVKVAVFVGGVSGAALGPLLSQWRNAVRDQVRGNRTLGGLVSDCRYDGSDDPADVTRGDRVMFTVHVLHFVIRTFEPA